MRLAVAFALFTTPLMAEDFYVSAPVVSAVVYSGAALVTRKAQVDLPAGQHRVLIPASDDQAQLQIETPGVQLIATRKVRDMDVEPALFFTPDQQAATALVGDLQAQIDALGVQIEARDHQIEGERVAVDFLRSTRASEGGIDTATLSDLADIIGHQVQHHLLAMQDIKEQRVALAKKLDALAKTLEVAKRALQDLNPPQDRTDMQVITVQVAAAVMAEFSLVEAVNAYWVPKYQFHLTSGAADPTGPAATLEIVRSISLFRDSAEPWVGIDLILSTINPRNVAPSYLGANMASILAPAPVRSEARGISNLAEPMVMVDEALPVATNVDGVAVEYRFPYRVTLGSGEGEALELALDRLTFPVRTEIHAIPRLDDTAYFMGIVKNAGDEPLLPGDALFYRDGHMVGTGHVDLIPAGGEDILAFGPVEGLRLTHRFGRNETGDTGIITSANTRSQEMWFTVENLTGEAQKLTAFYPLVFSEQEDLEIRLDVMPRPDEMDVDGKRGVAAWHMALAPGARREVQISVRLDWPDGQELRWYP